MQERRRPSPAARSGLMLLVMLVAVVLRSPLEVLTALPSTGWRTSTPTDVDPARVLDEEIMVPLARPASDPEVQGPPDLAGPGTTGRWGTPAPRPTTAILLEELRGGWRVESGVEEAAALAVIAAHAWATGKGLGSGAPGGAVAAIVTVEAIERPGAHHGVVTLLVAAGEDVHRLAVPVRFDTGTPTLAGSPWELPAPALHQEPLTGRAIGDPGLVGAARHALEAVGIDGGRMRALEATEGWPFIARLDDGSDPWLRWHVDRFVITGLPLGAVRENRIRRD